MNTQNTFHPGNRRYYGPKDGLSRKPLLPKMMGLATRTISSLVYKREVSGKENIPKDSGYIYSPNHENTFDPIVWRDLAPDDTRAMVSMNVFENPVTALGARFGGAYPVDHFQPSPATLEHSVNVIRQGSNQIIYPQGGFREDDQVGGIFKGASYAALKSGGKGIVPMGIHIEEAEKKKLDWKDALVGAGLATAVAALTLAGALLVAGAVAGGSALAIETGKLAKKLVPQKHYHDPMPNIASGIAGGVVGTLVGGATGAALAVSAPVLAPVVAAGVGGAAISKAIRGRPVAKVRFEQPLMTENYENNSDGARKLTTDLQQRISKAKSELSGVLVDESLPIFADKAWQAPE